MDMDMDMDRVSTPPHPTHSIPVVCGRTHALDCGSRRNAITDHQTPTQEECASGQEQRCSDSKGRHSTEG